MSSVTRLIRAPKSAVRKACGSALKLLGLRRANLRDSYLALRRIGDFKLVYRPDSVDEAVLNHSFDNDVFFPAIADVTIPDAGTIVDVGAHIGTFALLAAAK